MPRCKRCNLEHFNFQTCEHAAALADLEARRNQAPVRVLRPREGAQDFGNRTHTFQVGPGSQSLIPRNQHPAYEPSEFTPPTARDLTPPPFYDEAA